jgi:hypothetical protein
MWNSVEKVQSSTWREMKAIQLALSSNKDQLKFVIGSKADFDWSVALLSKHPTPAEVLFSPVFEASDTHKLGVVLFNLGKYGINTE